MPPTGPDRNERITDDGEKFTVPDPIVIDEYSQVTGSFTTGGRMAGPLTRLRGEAGPRNLGPDDQFDTT